MKATAYFFARGQSDCIRGVHWTRGIRSMKHLPQWARDAYIDGNVRQLPWKHILQPETARG